MKNNKEKIEFWLHTNHKLALKNISENTGYSVSELMRRGVELIIRDLSPYSINNLEVSSSKTKEVTEDGK